VGEGIRAKEEKRNKREREREEWEGKRRLGMIGGSKQRAREGRRNEGSAPHTILDTPLNTARTTVTTSSQHVKHD